MNKITKLCLFSLFMTVFMVSVGGLCSADSRNEYSGYPLRFDGAGIVDIYEGGNSIIISDSSYIITENTKFNRPGNLNCSNRWFKKKDLVYYIFEPDTLESNTKEIKSLWLVKDKYLGRGAP